MSDDQGAPCQTFLKIVGHVRRDRRISGSLKLTLIGGFLSVHSVTSNFKTIKQASKFDNVVNFESFKHK